MVASHLDSKVRVKNSLPLLYDNIPDVPGNQLKKFCQ